MPLKNLKPRLEATATQRLKPLTVQNTNARPAGETWQHTRVRIQVRDGSMCARCGVLWLASRDVVDHIVPRWAGGSDGDGNLWLLHADPCHREKTEAEAAMRAGGGYVMPDWVARRVTGRAEEYLKSKDFAKPPSIPFAVKNPR